MTITHYLNRIICGDCLTVMREMSDESVDLIVTSPPYNIRNSTGKPGRMRGRKLKAFLHNGYGEHDDCMPHDEYVAWQRECLTEMLRLIPDTGAIFYNHKWRVQNGLLQDRADIVKDFPVRQIIIWQRSGGINFNNHYFLPTYEVIYMIAKPKFKLVPEANRLGDVWSICQDNRNPHPAPFPIELPKRIINSTNADIILDPFCGSGTTAVAAKQLNRQYIGIEQSKKYCQIAEIRLKWTTTNFRDITFSKEDHFAHARKMIPVDET